MAGSMEEDQNVLAAGSEVTSPPHGPLADHDKDATEPSTGLSSPLNTASTAKLSRYHAIGLGAKPPSRSPM